MKKVGLKIIKFIFNIIKYIFLFSLYCSMPDKYNGTSYEDWLRDKN